MESNLFLELLDFVSLGIAGEQQVGVLTASLDQIISDLCQNLVMTI
jgi:hypothetical protein